MNNISESLFDSMSILFKDTLNKAKIARVVEATVVDLLDSSVGLYSIKYENQILKAYSNNIGIKYNTDDAVYVVCQDGTLDGSLIIIGAKTPYAGLYTANEEVRYIKVGDSLYTVNLTNTYSKGAASVNKEIFLYLKQLSKKKELLDQIIITVRLTLMEKLQLTVLLAGQLTIMAELISQM